MDETTEANLGPNQLRSWVLCAIWYHLHNFKNVKKKNWEILFLVKLQALVSNLQKVALLHVCFSRFINCTNGTKSRSASQLWIMELLITCAIIDVRQGQYLFAKHCFCVNFVKFEYLLSTDLPLVVGLIQLIHLIDAPKHLFAFENLLTEWQKYKL